MKKIADLEHGLCLVGTNRKDRLTDVNRSPFLSDSEGGGEVIFSHENDLELYSNNTPFTLSMKIKCFESDKEEKKFIKGVERHVRNSIEYRQWKQYIIEVLGLNHCVLTHEVTDECTIEVHHHVPSLYTVVKAVINEHISNNVEFSSFDIALKVMELHFLNKIGYVTLIKSLHEKFHNGHLDIPINFINGDYQYFINRFSNFLDPDDSAIMLDRLNVNESNCHWYRNTYKGVSDA